MFSRQSSSLLHHEKHVEQVDSILRLWRAIMWLIIVVVAGDGLLGCVLWRVW